MSILIIAPYAGLVQTAAAVVSADHTDCLVHQGNLQEAVKIAGEIRQRHEIDILISRGGTATLLAEKFDLPVIEIRVTGYDLLRAIYPHTVQGKRIAILGYENVIAGAQSIGEIVGQSLKYFSIRKDRDVLSAVDQASEWRAQVVVGDAVSVAAAKNAGMETELIQSGAESIRQALSEAFALRTSLQEQLSRTQHLKALVDHIEEGVLFLTAEDRITQVNLMAIEMLRVPVAQLAGRPAVQPNVLPPAIRKFISSGDEMSRIVVHKGKTLLVQRADIVIGKNRTGTAIIMRDVGRIQELEARIRKELSSKGLVAAYSFDQMIGSAAKFLRCVERARQCSKADSTILISGETGTGKEIFAQSIHNASSRKKGPFVAVNCAALPDSLLESELFGYVKGAFTGAGKEGKRGLFELAHGGSIFLDEINGMNINLQARFLRVLQEKQIMRIGDDNVIDVDVRVIAASNKDLFSEISNGTFRSDLYYRIKVLDIRVPPLRERADDIPQLVESFIRIFSKEYGLQEPVISKQLINRLLKHSWPGNVRELKNVAEKLVVLSAIAESEDELINEVTGDLESTISSSPVSSGNPDTLAETEYRHILTILAQESYNITQAAGVLGIDRTTLRRKLQRRRTSQKTIS